MFLMEKLGRKVGFIGAGNMACAILSGMIRAGLVGSTDTLASDVSQQQLEKIAASTGSRVSSDNGEVVRGADIVVLSTKPFHVQQVCEAIRGDKRPDQLFVSICAGITTAQLEAWLGAGTRAVRVMPNTPALIGCGAAGVAGGSNATNADVQTVMDIFQSVGVAVQVPESQLDLVTGLTGSGPAYVFYFMESLIKAGTELGLTVEQSEQLVKAMVYGAARMASERQEPLEALRQAVTTKGGTTEAGLNVLMNGDFPGLIKACVTRATERSRELSSGK